MQDSLRIIEGAIAITSFENINKQSKVLSINEMSVFDRELDYDAYPLAFSVLLTGKDKEVVQNVAVSLEGVEILCRRCKRIHVIPWQGERREGSAPQKARMAVDR